MLHLLGPQNCLKIISDLAYPFRLETGGFQCQEELESALGKYLNSIQPWIPPTPHTQLILSNLNEIDTYIECFNEKSALSDINYSVTHSKSLKPHLSEHDRMQLEDRSNHLVHTLRQFQAVFPLGGDFFKTLIKRIFIADSKEAAGGTTSSAIGVLWANPRPKWTLEDYLEFFIHELTHTLMFLDERRHRHYKDLSQIIRSENFAQSAILSRPRPADKVLHSLVVTCEVLLFREAREAHKLERHLHPPTQTLLSQIKMSLESLTTPRIQSLLTDRAKELVLTCAQAHSSLNNMTPGTKVATHA